MTQSTHRILPLAPCFPVTNSHELCQGVRPGCANGSVRADPARALSNTSPTLSRAAQLQIRAPCWQTGLGPRISTFAPISQLHLRAPHPIKCASGPAKFYWIIRSRSLGCIILAPGHSMGANLGQLVPSATQDADGPILHEARRCCISRTNDGFL